MGGSYEGIYLLQIVHVKETLCSLFLRSLAMVLMRS